MVRPRIGKNLDKAMSKELDLEQPTKIRNNCKLTRSWVWDKKGLSLLIKNNKKERFKYKLFVKCLSIKRI